MEKMSQTTNQIIYGYILYTNQIPIKFPKLFLV